MQLFQQISNLVVWLLILPLLIGIMPAYVIERNKRMPGTIYLSGWLVMGTIFQLFAVPFIFTKKSLTELEFVYSAVIIILGFCGLLFYVIGITHDGAKEFLGIEGKRKKNSDKGQLRYWIIFGGLLLFQLIMSICMRTSDGDDAYYIVHAVMADELDTMYLKNAYTGGHGSLDLRHTLAPFSMFYAMLARKSEIPATIIAHLVMPLILIPITYIIYYKIGRELFRKEQEKLPIFLILLSGIALFGRTSVYTNETFFLTRTWQGKSMLANIALPAALYVLYMICKYTEKRIIEHNSRLVGWFFMLLMVNFVGALFSSLGLLLLGMLEAVIGLLITIRNRKPWVILGILSANLPSIVYILLYIKV